MIKVYFYRSLIQAQGSQGHQETGDGLWKQNESRDRQYRISSVTTCLVFAGKIGQKTGFCYFREEFSHKISQIYWFGWRGNRETWQNLIFAYIFTSFFTSRLLWKKELLCCKNRGIEEVSLLVRPKQLRRNDEHMSNRYPDNNLGGIHAFWPPTRWAHFKVAHRRIWSLYPDGAVLEPVVRQHVSGTCTDIAMGNRACQRDWSQ